MPEGGKREDLYNVFITITGSDGKVVKIQCDKMGALGMKAKGSTYRPANGLANEVSLGGPRKADSTTLNKLWDNGIDANAHWFLEQCGRATVLVTKEAIDENGAPFGAAKRWPGKLDDFTEPAMDSESEKPALCMFAVTLETNVG